MPRERLRLARNTATLLAVATALTVAGGSASFAFSRGPVFRRSPISAAASAGPPAAPTAQAATTSAAAGAPSAVRAAGSYRVVGLGDSVPAGTACGCTSYISLVGQRAASQHARVAAISNLAESGLTTAGLAAQLRQTGVREKLADADLIIITIGANDFDEGLLTASACRPTTVLSCYQSTYQSALTAQRSTLASTLAEISALHPDGGATVLVTGYWNVFLDGQVGRSRGTAYVQASNALTRTDNAMIAAVAAAHDATYVDIYTPFKGDGTGDDTALLAIDGDHPDAAGHALIAQTLLRALT